MTVETCGCQNTGFLSFSLKKNLKIHFSETCFVGSKAMLHSRRSIALLKTNNIYFNKIKVICQNTKVLTKMNENALFLAKVSLS